MPVNRERIIQNLEKLALFGLRPNGGIQRHAITQDERDAVRFISDLMTDAGMEVSVDPIGNLIGRLEGKSRGQPVVMIGSHLDTVPGGGKYDGALGVVAGVEVLKALQEDGLRPCLPIEVMAFVNEEGHRFPPGLTGSHAVTYGVTEDMLSRLYDDEGMSFAEALRQFGLDPARVDSVRRDPRSIRAFIELHVEQGGVLDEQGLPVGIVTGITGMVSARVEITGLSNHAGTTPMRLRKDALAGAAEVILLVEEVAKGKGGPDSVATVGMVRPEPGASNVIAGKVNMTLDVRDIEQKNSAIILEEIDKGLRRICQKRGLTGHIVIEQDTPPRMLSDAMIELLEKGFVRRGHQPFHLVSGAGHDAMLMSDITDVGMLFVRSHKGISHSPDEYSSPEDIGVAVEILYDIVQDIAGI